MARAAVESLQGVDRYMMGGTRGTLVLEPGAKLEEAQVKAAIQKVGLQFDSLERVRIERPALAYVAKTPKFT